MFHEVFTFLSFLHPQTISPQIVLFVMLLAALLGIASYLTFKKANDPGLDTETNKTLHIKTAYDCIGSLLSLLYAILISILRKGKSLPITMTGTHPYIFDRECKVELTLYSKMRIWLFGGMAFLVSLYVFFSTYEVLTRMSGNENEVFILIFSAIASVIVYSCDKIILSYPSVNFDITSLIIKERAKNAQSKLAKYLIHEPSYYLMRLAKLAGSLIFSIARLALALSISCVLILPAYVISNDDIISKKTARTVTN